MLPFGVWSLSQKMWFISPHMHLFLNMHAHFNKREISKQSKSAAHPLSPEQPGVGTLLLCQNACQARHHHHHSTPHPPSKGWARGSSSFSFPFRLLLGKELGSLCCGLGDSSLAHIWGKIKFHIYIYFLLGQLSSEETKVWRIDQCVEGSTRPLNSYPEGTESLPFAAKLCSAIHSLVIQRKCFKVHNKRGKKPHKFCYERWVGSDLVTPHLPESSAVSYIGFSRWKLDISMMTDRSKT